MNYPYRYLLAFGSNLGNRHQNIRWALDCFREDAILKNRINILRVSPFQETAPLRNEFLDSQEVITPLYINLIADIATDFRPIELYENFRGLENFLGHPRDFKWSNRQLDIDLLLWATNNHKDFAQCEKLVYNDECLQFYIPHKELKNRRFLQDLMQLIKE